MENLVEIDGMRVRKVSDELYEVYSGDEKYVVIFDADGTPACTCKGYWFNGHCKHIDAVKNMRR